MKRYVKLDFKKQRATFNLKPVFLEEKASGCRSKWQFGTIGQDVAKNKTSANMPLSFLTFSGSEDLELEKIIKCYCSSSNQFNTNPCFEEVWC